MQFNDLRNLKRFKDITAILARYGFEEIVQRMEIPGAGLIRKINPSFKNLSVYERIRCAIEDLGPTFIKFGQLMSLRPDLLPGEMLTELEKLQDDVVPVALEDVEQVVQDCLGKPVSEVFSIFDAEPAAAASLSQVHKAVLRREGQIVSVKIQRPGIEEKIQADLDILEGLAGFLDQTFEELSSYDLPELIQVIRRHLETETDFTIELRNMKIARSLAAETPVTIPRPYERYCSRKLLVMEWIQGAKYSEVTPESAYDGRRIAVQGLLAAVKQILEDGFFHADPHPGNLLITEEMHLCIIDWGMVGRLTGKDRSELIDLLHAVAEKDSESLTQSLLSLCRTGSTNAAVFPESIERDLLSILDMYYAVPIKEMNIGQLLMDMMRLLREHQLKLPTEYVIMIKALVTAEGSARQAYPELNIVSEIRDVVSRLARARLRPEVIWRHLRSMMSNFWSTQRELPRQFHQIISKLDSGDLGLQLHLNKLEQLVNSLENASNRLTAAIITAAVIMGSSMIITTGIGPYLFGFPALGVIGYLISVVLGLWLVITIIRTRKY